MDGATTKFTVPDLREGTEYRFRVIAVNAEGQSEPLEGKETAKPAKKICEFLQSFYADIITVLLLFVKWAWFWEIVILQRWS